MMDHGEATRRLAAEQYLLGELNEAEQEEFELHFFSCSDCAEAVASGAALVADVKAVLAEEDAFGTSSAAQAGVEPKRWWSFWTEWRWAPALGLAGWAVAAILGGYEWLHGPSGVTPLTLASAVSVRAVRSGQDLTFSKRNGTIALDVAHEWEQNYAGYQGEIERAADHRVVLSGVMAEAPNAAAAPLSVSIQPKTLPAGSYFFVLYGLPGQSSEKTLVERISFTLTE
jgi:anti-sigma factor RsiW